MNKFFLLCLALSFTLFARAQEEETDLYALSLEDLMNLKVTTASKSEEKVTDAPGIVTTITAREIEQFGGISLADVLDRVVGVQNMNTHVFPQNVTSIRGDLATGYDTHVLFLLNGRPTRESMYGGVNMPILLAMPLNMIERIEFVRGPGSVLYGTNAYSGVVNIITKDAEGTSGKVGAMAGAFGATGVDGYATVKKNDLRILAGIKSFQEDGWTFRVRDASQATNPDGGRTTQTNYAENEKGATFTVDYKNLHVNSFITTSDQIAFGGANPTWNTGDGDTLSNTVANRSMIDAGYEFKISEKFSTNVNASYHHSVYENPFSRVHGFTEDYFYEVTNFIKPMQNLNVLVGGTYYKQTGKYTLVFPSGTVINPVPFYNREWYSGYIQADYRPIKKLKLIAGAQYNKIDIVDANIVPRVGAIYNITDKLGVKLLYGKAFRAPYAYETRVNLFTIVSDSLLKPEVISNFDAQLFYSAKKVELAATYFKNVKTDNILRVRVNSFVDRYENNGEIDSHGLEFEGKYIPNKSWYFTGSYMYQYNSQVLYDTIHTSDYSLMPNHMMKLGVHYKAPFGLSVGVFENYVTNFYEVSTAVKRNATPDGFNYLTAQINLDITKLLKLEGNESIILGLHGINLLDEDIYTPDFASRKLNSIPARSERAFYGSLTVKF